MANLFYDSMPEELTIKMIFIQFLKIFVAIYLCILRQTMDMHIYTVYTHCICIHYATVLHADSILRANARKKCKTTLYLKC